MQNVEKVYTMLRKSEKVCCKLGKKCSKSFTHEKIYIRFLVNFFGVGVGV